jgi:hypothetical protein
VALIARHRAYFERSIEAEPALADAVRRARLALATRTVGNIGVNALVRGGIAAIYGALIVVIAGRGAGRSVNGTRLWPPGSIDSQRAGALAAAYRAEKTQTSRCNNVVKWRRSRKHRFVSLHLARERSGNGSLF